MWFGKEDTYATPEALIKAIHEHITYHNETRIVIKLRASPIEYRKSIINL